MDSNGFLWIGTIDGLNRFDGKSVKIYRHNPADDASISDNFIHGILEDEMGMLWIGTRDGGINKFNPKTETFSRFRHDETDSLSIPAAPVYLLIKDKDGDFLASIGDKAFGVFTPERNEFRAAEIRSRSSDREKELFSPNAFIQFNDGSLLCASFSGLYYISAGEMQAFKTGVSKNILYAQEIKVISSLNSQNFSRLTVTHNQYLNVYVKNNGILNIQINRLPDYVQESMRAGMSNTRNCCRAIENDTYLMAATPNRGLMLEHKKTGKRMYKDVYVDGKLFVATALYRDPRNGLWAYSWGNGFIRIEEQAAIQLIKPEHYPNMGPPFILALEEEPNKGVWFGGRDGLYFMDAVRDEVIRYPLLSEFFAKTEIWAFERDKEGLWVSTVAEGLFFVPVNEQGKPGKPIRNFTPENSILRSYSLHHILMDSRGWLWVGYEGDGLQLIKNPSDLFTKTPANVIHFSQNTDSEHKIGGNKIRRIYEDRNGNIWLATMNNGFTEIAINNRQVQQIRVLRHDPENTNSISFNDGRSMYQQNDNTYWFATYGGGITRWNSSNNTFKRIGTQQGLPNNSTYGILPESDNIHLWISTNNGLARLNTQTLSFQTFGERDGLQNKEFNTGAFLKLKDGKLAFGGIGGFNIIDPVKLHFNNKKPSVKLTSIRVFNEPFVTDTAGAYLKKLTLPYDQNFLSFEFAALDFDSPSENSYAYKMDGIDEDWVHTGNRNFADYPNLKPGLYSFKVKAANSDGVWNEDGVTLSLQITPPWWQTRWFRVLYGTLVIIGFIAGIRYIAQRRLRKQLHKMEIENRLKSERERISRDLHDHVGAQLANIISGLSLIEKYSMKNMQERAAELMNSLRGDAHVTITQLRETIWALNQNSLSIEGFIDHLKDYFNAQSALNKQLDVRYINNINEEVILSSVQALNLFRIIQEAAQNTLKYAEASTFTLTFTLKDNLMQVYIKDDGNFKAENSNYNGGHGLGNMRKRALEIGGVLELCKENGTEITVSFAV